jgi:hypothetical protein
MQHLTGTTRPPARLRRPAIATAVALAAALVLAGCSGGGGHDIGEGVSTKLNDSDFTGQAVLTTTKVERVTVAAMHDYGLTLRDDDAYFAHFTVRVQSGTFPRSATKDFGNTAWGLRADGKLQAGPTLIAGDRSTLLQGVCPFRASAFAAALRAGRTAKGCAVLLAPEGSTVTGVTYMRAAPVDDGPKGDATITWTKQD